MKCIPEIITAYINTNETNWEDNALYLIYAYNTSKHSTTRWHRNYLLFEYNQT